MTSFAIDVAILLSAAYLTGCIGGCWLRRLTTGRR